MKIRRFRDWRMVFKIMTIPVFSIACVLLLLVFHFLPLIDKKLMNEKKVATKHLVEVAFTLISDYHLNVASGKISEYEAKREAMARLRALRYKENDYFWINDLNTVMLMHPIKPELEGKDLRNFRDPNGTYIFRKFVDIAKKRDEGFIDYLWPKPGSDQSIPKLSYVRLFKPWGWIVGTGIYVDDVKVEVGKMRFQLLSAAIALSFLLLISTYLIARIISHPLHEAVMVFNQVAEGDLTVRVTLEEGRRDEVGILMNALSHMLGKLRDQTRMIMEGANTIASSIRQISVTSTRLATVSEETSGSLSEISTTVEQVRETAYLANEKAEQVAKGADHASLASDRGRKSVADATTGIRRIKEEMASVAESILKLDEQTRRVGEIISTVKDLANQSNLLSVNASIEAAKAGSYGKGFAIVAQEIKSLADQSREATSQVKNILNEILKATDDSVMATERGEKAVEAGTHLSHQSGEAIDMLSRSVNESAHAAIQIAASGQEQLAGMDQLAQAIENIKTASMQNAEGAKQLETAAKDLEALGEGLSRLASMFKV